MFPRYGPAAFGPNSSAPAANAAPAAEAPAAGRAKAERAGELAFLKIRYKLPSSDTSTLITRPITTQDAVASLDEAPVDARFAVAVAGFGEWLRGDRQVGTWSLDDMIALAQKAKGEDAFGYRAEFVNLLRAAKVAKGLPR